MNVDVLSEVPAEIISDLNGIEENLRFLGCKHSIGKEHWRGPNDQVRKPQETKCSVPEL